jgi:hypothetical protein
MKDTFIVAFCEVIVNSIFEIWERQPFQKEITMSKGKLPGRLNNTEASL